MGIIAVMWTLRRGGTGIKLSDTSKANKRGIMLLILLHGQTAYREELIELQKKLAAMTE